MPRSMKTARWIASALAALASPQAPGVTAYEALKDARDLICEFNRAGAAASRSRDPDMLMVIENIVATREAARIVSSRSVGAKPVRVYATGTGVHFVQDLSESVIVTTVLACDQWRVNKDGKALCRRFAAVNAWHFDQSVHRNPDRAFLRLPGTSYAGFCEPWNLD
ncbi:MAG: hypothetical protein A3I00_04230 [Betaproteobacteria bacterium RIFCSPLOWO2_02_FULL_64_12]|nr:MAG: hypothetical protein A3I00_04230 [Betaproteobacteria bacterium RIFCSPLOWO2_02_FULL_64_12]